MATVIQRQNPYAGLLALGQGLIQGQDKRFQRNQLNQGLTPEQQQALSGLPLQQAQQIASMGANRSLFQSPAEKAVERNTLLQAKINQGFLSQGITPPTSDAGRQFNRMTPEQQASFLDVQSGRKARPSVGGDLASVTFGTDFTDSKTGKRVRDNTTVKVPRKFEAAAQELGNAHGTLDPSDIFTNHVDSIAEDAGLIEINDNGKIIIDKVKPLDPEDIKAIIPDVIKASSIKGVNPVDAIQDMFSNWESLSFEDKGEGVFTNLAETVGLTEVAGMPTTEEQNAIILQSVASLIDDESTLNEISQVLQTGDPEEIEDSVEALRGAFGGRKRRPQRSK